MIIGGILFVLGLVVGSFLNSFLYRYQTKETYLGRSFCPKCKHQIAGHDNIPIISYIILGGNCRHCKKPISIQYPIIELLTGATFLLIGVFSIPGIYLQQSLVEISNFKFQISNQILILNVLVIVCLLLIVCCLLLIAVYDFKTKEIPNGFNLVFIISAGIYLILSNLNSPNFLLFTLSADAQGRLFYFLLAGVSAFLFFYAMVWFSKETWMGGGDAKFAFGMGILLGPLNTFLAILIASWVGAIYGVSTLLKQKTINNKQLTKRKPSQLSIVNGQLSSRHEVPFGPFLALGTAVSFLFGSQIIAWYAKIFLGF